MDAATIALPRETLVTWLQEAQAARHAIMTGKKPSYISHGPTARTYKIDHLAELDAYIAELSGAIAAKDAGRTHARRPIHIGIGGGA